MRGSEPDSTLRESDAEFEAALRSRATRTLQISAQRWQVLRNEPVFAKVLNSWLRASKRIHQYPRTGPWLRMSEGKWQAMWFLGLNILAPSSSDSMNNRWCSYIRRSTCRSSASVIVCCSSKWKYLINVCYSRLPGRVILMFHQ